MMTGVPAYHSSFGLDVIVEGQHDFRTCESHTFVTSDLAVVVILHTVTVPGPVVADCARGKYAGVPVSVALDNVLSGRVRSIEHDNQLRRRGIGEQT